MSDKSPAFRTLIVEDDASSAVAMMKLLSSRLNADVRVAEDCASARRALSASGFDVVTIDRELPDGDGVDLLEELADVDPHPLLIMVTGRRDELAATRCFRAGAAGYVIKDAGLEVTLVDAVNRALAGSRVEAEHREATAALRASEEMYRNMAESMNDVLWTTGMDLKTTYVSPSIEKVLGFTPEEHLNRPIEEQLTAESLRIAALRWADELAHDSERDPERITLMDLDFYHKDGSVRTMEMQISMIRDGDGDPAGLQGVSRDVTERKRIEDALQESEERFRKIAETANDAIIMIDSAGRIKYWNPAAERIFGYTQDETLGEEIAPLLSLPESREKYVEEVREFTVTGSSPLLGEVFESLARDKYNTGVPVEVSSAAFISAGEWNAVANVRDITERVRARELAREHAAELRDLVDIAAHELRHPATIFKGYAQLLLQHGNDLAGEITREALVAMDEAADRLSKQINRLLDTSRIESGKLELDLVRADPRQTVFRAVDEAKALSGGIDAQVVSGSASWTVDMDQDKIQDVLVMLLDNANKHAPDTGVVEVECTTEDGRTSFSVSDRGAGIPDEERDRIFERFYQVGETLHHSAPGMGLGLYISRCYVEAHGGWITVEERSGGGTTFRFSIPNRQP